MTAGSGSPTGDAQSAGRQFAQFVVEELTAEDARRVSLETRGLAVITTSGTLVTLVLALTTLVTNQQGSDVPRVGQGPLVASLVAFVLAAALGIATNAPQLYRAVDPVALKTIVRERWALPADDAVKTVAATHLVQLQSAQRSNDLKGWLLLAAVAVEGVAILFLAWTAVLRVH